jgi:signal transduction histidine kinase
MVQAARAESEVTIGDRQARRGVPVGSGSEELERIFPGPSEMASRLRSFDWSRNVLGPPSAWPQNLKGAVRITLMSRQPMFVWWGEQLINLYNDGYARFLHGKHPWALGQPAASVWPEIWEQVSPRLQLAMRLDEGTYDEAFPFIMLRKGYPEATWVTFSYSPITNDQGGAGGILCPVTEETRRIVDERQLALMSELAARTADARTWQQAFTHAASALATDAEDFPFALLYVAEPGARTWRSPARAASLAGWSGVSPGGASAPTTISLDAPSLWNLDAVLRDHRACLIPDLRAVSSELPTARGGHPVVRALSLPIAPSGHQATSGVLVAGLSPLRGLDAGYRGFLDLVAGQLAASLGNIDALETERRRAEALAELDRAKTEFFNDVSHELRTPLTLILGPLEDALSRIADISGADGVRANLDTVRRNALRLLRLVNDLLDLSRIEAGRGQAHAEPTDLAAFTSELASVFAPAVERAGLRFVARCEPLSQPVQVDRRMWEKIVLNLLSNALKFTVSGEISLRLGRADDGIELSVEDTGAGIPADELPRVFDRFYRVQGAASRTADGSGIGLALIQELVKQHGGRVSVVSTVGRGTTFTVILPLGASPPAPATGAPGERSLVSLGAASFVEEALGWQVPEGRPSGPGKSAQTVPDRFRHARVLFVDDNPEVRAYIRGLLDPWFDVDAVANGAEALEACRRRRPDLLLSDVMMPVMDGFALLRAIRGDPTLRAMPVILLSARAGEDSRVEGLQEGADDYLVKPFSSRELLARVRANLEMAELRMEVARERSAREETHKVLVDELQHRVRNLLAIVRTIAAQAIRSGGSPAQIEAQLDDRLAALGRLQTLLTRDRAGVTLRDLILMELAAIAPGPAARDGRVVLDGPEVKLPRRCVQTFALALHELGTNALKYGALLAPEGRLAITWRVLVEDGLPRRLVLEWVESGVPRRGRTGRPGGFGRELIEEALPFELEARTRFELARDGVRCRIELPLERLGERAA